MKKNMYSLEAAFRLSILFVMIFLSFVIIGCTEEDTPALPDPFAASTAAPVIDSVTPAGSTLAGAIPVVIYGKNFSPNIASNFVYFNGKQGTILSATTTKLTINTPLVIDTVQIRATVFGAMYYSNSYSYILKSAIDTFVTIAPPAGVASMTPDKNGNLYFDQLFSGADDGVKIMSTTGTITAFAPKTTGLPKWTSLKIGPGGDVYAARNFKAIYKFAAAGGAAATIFSPTGTLTATDLDFDQNKNLWSVGNNDSIFYFTQAKVKKSFPFKAFARSVRIYNGYLYVAALKDSVEQVFRAQIVNDSIGTPQPYFNITTQLGATYTGQSITFASNGDMYLGTQAPKCVVVVHPDGTFEIPYAVYNATFESGVYYLAWGSGDGLFASSIEGKLIRIHTLKTGAPYLGAN